MARTKQTAKRGPQKADVQTMKSRYFCSCRNFSTGHPTALAEFSHCSLKRCIEPLAWNPEHSIPVVQTNCPLFTKIPKELRDLIFEYALTESLDLYRYQVATNTAVRTRGDTRGQNPDRPENLLLTCWAIYQETYLLPIVLNPLRFPYLSGINKGKPRVTLPWQFANIQAFDITLPQVALEGDCLYNFLFSPTGWHPEARHKGVYVSPYVGLRNTTGGSCRSFDFTLLPANDAEERVRLSHALQQLSLPSSFQAPESSMRLQRARPLVHLTLRIPSTNWWTWTDDPRSADTRHHHLGLEPALGDGRVDLNQRPTCTRMQELAQQRRDGYLPVSRNPFSRTKPGWAHIIAKLPDIKTLELVLETFEEKKAQLDMVVECAKTWRFPITDTEFELEWNGKVEEERWCKPLIENWETQRGEWYSRSTSFEGRTIRFTRRRTSHQSGDEACKVH
ncbi:hypothetical protein E8E12_001275 [Didymella heteroderae]|uniref:Uncharacterized protein n=1 Tax=Didymella heteroderae TaxID=1769908 RepID=A0A9P4WI11_9PLEO|nr:hypothetical protein E8E12_001275 [Didymella heteroderae]